VLLDASALVGVATMSSGSSTGAANFFAGEPYLRNPPPDYPAEWSAIVVKLVATVVFFVVVVPLLLPIVFGVETEEEARGHQSNGIETKSNGSGSIPSGGGGGGGSGKKPHRSKRRKPTQKTTNEPDTLSPQSASAVATSTQKVTIVATPPLLLPLLNVLCLVICFVIIASSPNNYTAARAVFQAPLLSPDECQYIIDMAHRAAERNLKEVEGDRDRAEFLHTTGISRIDDDAEEFVEKQQQEEGAKKGRSLFDEPKGWRKDRHDSYPTTDLNLVTDSFTKGDRAYIANILDARLSPLLQRVYGIAPGAVRANDIFIVRYDYENGQKSLRGHTDSSHVSFNVLLNEDFTGGGTRYHNRVANTYTDGKPPKGDVLVNNAMVYHEGLPVTSGTRYIMVGFMGVDRVDPITLEPTGLNLFSSWLSLPWTQVNLKEAIYVSYQREESSPGSKRWTDTKFVRNLFHDIVRAAQIMGDLWSPHTLTKLVNDANATEYIKALDAAEDARRKKEEKDAADGGKAERRASWFKNQQIHVDIDGSVGFNWDTREAAEEKFKEL